ncbi:putative secreted protein (Por secretion system target) [Thermoflavifilum aggregans]|uniref:Putative secreted protein (Por secretion system target) n=2 Tax=Thermoflavifilum aggregans TaxID=454188 RepID=A0A2M9CXG6_9BACT|nr:putative secreted protein (Por secretion system target) [Thermoflavifilum aggregans]
MKKTSFESKICVSWHSCFRMTVLYAPWKMLTAVMLCLPFISLAQGDQSAIQVPINQYGSTEGALLHLPDDYASTSHTYPLLVFFHGSGESGTDLSKIYNSTGAGGPAYFIAHNQWPSYFINPKDGMPYKFIVVSPQASSWSTDFKAVPYILAFLVQKYRVDTNRIYLTGLSAGGWTTWNYSAHYQVTPNFKAAAIVPMSMATTPSYPDAYNIASDSIYAWGFGDPSGDLWGLKTEQGMDSINAYAPGHARFTSYHGGHCCWNNYYNPNYRETINGKSMNIYEWMLQYARGAVDSLPPSPNQPPVVKLSSKNVTTTLPVDSVQVDGSGSYDPDGTITNYQWKQISGPNQAKIITPNQPKTWLDSLQAGSYRFTLTVTDNGGLQGVDTVTIQVNPAPPKPPVVKLASRFITITLPTDSVYLDASASTDPDGTIIQYRWAQISGNTARILSPAQASTWVTGLQTGNAAFLITITDNNGLSSVDTVFVTVNPAPAQYPPVIVLKTKNISITLPNDSVYLDASGSYDSLHTITTYQWALNQGDASAVIVSPARASTIVKNLKAGIYVFTITVTDDAGLQATDTVKVYVQNPPNQPPVANIRTSTDSVYLPVDSLFLDGSGSYDPEGGRLTYLWKQVSGPAPAVIRSSNQAQTWISQLIAGTYQFSLTVTDSTGASAADSVFIQVIAPVVIHKRIILPVWNQLWYPNIDSQFNIQPGDTICIPAGDYPNLSIEHLNGSPEAPVVIQNCGGVVRIGVNNTGGYTFIIGNHSSYFEINGSGTPGIEYGFELVGTPASEGGGAVNGIILQEHTDHFKVHNVFINHVRGSGIVCLTRAVCSDPSTWRQNYTMEDIKFYHIKVVGTGYEGFYIGRTADYQVDNTCTPDTLYNPLIKDIEIYDNTFDSTGNDAIQLAEAYYGTNLIHDNYINYPGLNGGYGQGMGILIGGNTRAEVYNNVINHAQTLPVQVLGAGLTKFYNNVICNSNTDGIQIGGGEAGIEPTAVWVFNNTFVNIKGNGIIVWGTTTDTINRFYNNLLVNIQKPLYDKPDSGFYIPPAVSIGYQIKYDIRNNLFISDINKAGFVNPAADNYHLLPSSPAVDAGMDLRSYGITTDLDGNARPYGATFDIGAYEYAPHPNKPPVAKALASADTIRLPADSVLLDGSLSSDPDGYITTYFWQLKQGPAGWKIDSASSPKTWVHFSKPGNYLFQLNVTDNAGATATDTVWIVVVPATNRPPVAVTNRNIIIYLPVDSALLDGSASYDPDDSDFTHLHFNWTKVQAPGAYIITDSLSAKTWVKGLVAGQYIFKLTVTDAQGATDSGYVTVNVNPNNTHAPVANAGPDRTIQLPQDTVWLDASRSSDSSGSIAYYQWQILAAPPASHASFSDSLSSQTILQNLTAGKYVIQLTVADSNHVSASDQLTIIILPPANKPPIANAGADITIILPYNTATLNGSASYDPDGSIVSYSWSYVSGPNVYTITGANTPKPTLYGLVEGTYVFQLTVTDNNGATASDTVQIIVKPSPNIPPVADIRGDTLVIFPNNALVLDGSQSYDPDGSIVSYQWNQIAGPTDITVQGWDSSMLSLQNLDVGTYTFTLTVTDNSGAKATSRFSFTVQANGSTQNSSLILYPNPVSSILHVFFYSPDDGPLAIRIFDLTGKLMSVYQANKSHTNSFSQDIDVHNLVPGLYLLNVTGLKNISVTQKFLKL